MVPGLILAAPASGSGKTLVTLALLRALRDRGVKVASAKVGPDYIDPAFHRIAAGAPCHNLDSWMMRPEGIAALVADLTHTAELVVAEGVMGLFDGGPGGAGSTAELARTLGWPVVLIVDARGMAASAAALLKGFMTYDAEVRITGVIFNRIGGSGHAEILRDACRPLDVPVLGTLPRCDDLELTSRHLGLVQAGEHPDLESFLGTAAAILADRLDIDKLRSLATQSVPRQSEGWPGLPPLGQRIAVAQDVAFAFAYPFLLEGWRRAGAEISFFSPLEDEPPDSLADAVYLPGGYPELHGGRLANNTRFQEGLRSLAAGGATVYGECGGFMSLGRGLVDAEGERHAMVGLLPLETSFADRNLSLGYRAMTSLADSPLGPAGSQFRGHEFHYASILSQEGPAAFRAQNASARTLGEVGLHFGKVFGSFMHLADCV